MKLLLAALTLLVADTAIAQCPGGVCPTQRAYRGPRVYQVYRDPAPAVRYYRPLPVYRAAPVFVQPAPSFHYSSPSRSFGVWNGGFYYNRASRCPGGRCR